MNNTNTNNNTNTTRSRDVIIADILTVFKEDEELFADVLEELDSWNGFLGDDRWEDMEELDEIFEGKSVTYILDRAFYGYDADTWHTDSHGEKEYDAFNPNRNYFRFNGYGNLVSSDYKDYSDYLDENTVETLERDYYRLDTITDNDELNELFEELENAED